DWTDADGVARVVTLEDGLTIGRRRHAAGDLVLADEGVSRQHARIGRGADGRFRITDLQSRNGTEVNDTLLRDASAELRPGDRITVGRTTFTFTAPTPAPPPSADAAQAAPRVVAAALAPDGNTIVSLSETLAGWLEGSDGQRHILGGETRIGRAAKNDITIDDRSVSRNHAHIRRIGGRYVLSDLGSLGGVRVNGEPVLTPRELADGDTIEIGATALRFSLAPFSGAEDGAPALDGGGAAGGALPTSIFQLAPGLPQAAIKGDLREVTMLFADMHGFTAISGLLNNPEQTTLIMNQVFEMLTAEIVRYGGAIDKYAGDNIMALFGAPRAHEDDPERAIQAALAMQRALEGFNARLARQIGHQVQMRIGINTGEVLFGQVGGGQFRTNTVMGPPVNLASRLEHAARVGHILVGETTYECAKHAFHFTPLPPTPIKGIAEPVQAYEVVREKRADEILREPAGGDYLIGREQELQQLRGALDDVQAGQGRLLAIIGDVGIGKSQLLAAFRRSYGEVGARDGGGAAWIVERCASYEATAPYAALAGLLRALLGLNADEAPDRAKLLGALKALLPRAEDGVLAEYLALLGQILGVKVNNAFIAGLDAKVRRKLLTEMVRAIVAAYVGRDGRPRPLVLVLEEMQWADSGSIDALDDLIDALPAAPVLLLITYRPEWSHGWAGRPFYRQIHLAELSPEGSRRFLRQQLPEAELPDAVADAVIAQCGGNPLLLAETVRSLRERGALVSRKGRWTLTADVSLLNIPSNLRGIMMARIDRLGARERAVLQQAAVIGRTFTHALLATVTGLDDEIDDSLAILKDQDLIVENPLAAEPEYSFKHTIVQEIAYNNVLAAERRILHEQIGAALEQLGGGRADDGVEILAHHYGRSGAKAKAVEYLLRAGEKARRLYANDTAIAHFEEALEKLRGLPPGERDQDPTRAVRLHETLADVRLLTADFVRAQEGYEAGVAEPAAPPADKARLWNKLGLVWERRGDYRRALSSYRRGLGLLGDGGA
ncbi:MAG: FHA domain-containing protein, partial [Chloroflexota bacterium]|nr:FHA domain-containing protein [Chloroflexota bacterium]